jgi:hypothetical protein
MGYDLVSGERYFRWSIYNYGKILRFAIDYGWEPKGTVSSDDPDWKGDYFGQSGQTVTSEDANNLADALDRALNDRNRPAVTEEDEQKIIDTINDRLNDALMLPLASEQYILDRIKNPRRPCALEGDNPNNRVSYTELIKANNETLHRRSAIAANAPNGATLENLLNIYDQTVRTDYQFSEYLRDFIAFLRGGEFRIC